MWMASLPWPYICHANAIHIVSTGFKAVLALLGIAGLVLILARKDPVREEHESDHHDRGCDDAYDFCCHFCILSLTPHQRQSV